MKVDTNVKIIKELKILSRQKTGWSRELNYVSWVRDGREYPKYDIRDWNEDHTEYGKGITLSDEEYSKLKDFFLSEQNNNKRKVFVPEGLL